ncbi:MAG TPA: hypothetical protein VGW39_06380 [Chthoniobacterales bacterium]|nr:hypothetical protein [Chthoniobacterales bacterium]
MTIALSDFQPVGVRLQKMDAAEQTIILARLAETRNDDGEFAPKQLEDLFVSSALPKPSKVSNAIAKLQKQGYLTNGRRKGAWRITPFGRQASLALFSNLDLTAFSAESKIGLSFLGHVAHTVVPPVLGPPSLISGLQKFLVAHPFEKNVFGMTRFPEIGDKAAAPDPIGPALEIAREVCSAHGLEFHLASDRAIDDDLWKNVAAHMWASQYGIAFFENRSGKGLNYNLTIEVGGMLITGRRCALLKDSSIDRMPSDLVGQIYKSIDFDKSATVRKSLHQWIRDDLSLGTCATCRQ